jgi:ribosomal protein S18 acetylase RimI-like enzyme
MPAASDRSTIRSAQPTDAGTIGKINVLSWRAAYTGQLPESFLATLSVRDRQEAWQQRLADPQRCHQVLVVETGTGVTGFSVTGPSGDDDGHEGTAELNALYLDPDHWGRGLGRLLHDHAVNDLRAAGFGHATLWVLATNIRARRFYERAGWQVEGSRKIETIGAPPVELDQVRYTYTLKRNSTTSPSDIT